MRIPRTLWAVASALTRARLRRHAAGFLAATRDCRQAQRNVLQRLIELNGDSRFASEFRLNEVRGPADLRRRLPVTNYEFFRPYVEELKIGNHRALLGRRNSLLMFSLSSGTTAESKFVPITDRFLRDYRRGWHIWGVRAFDEHPAANFKNIVQLSSDYDRFRTVGGTPCGNISGLAAAMQKRIVRFMYTVPGIVSKIEDPDAKYYMALRLAIADDNVGMIMTANPSTLTHLARFADAEKSELVRDIFDGTLSSKYPIDARLRRQLPRQFLRANPARALELDRIVKRTGKLHPKDYWPNIDILAVWTAGSCSAYLGALREFYGGVTIRDHGLSASEGRMTIPLWDERSDGVLDITSHYFEFIPEEEYGTDSPTVLEAHELVEGRNYFILLTTSSGFYRYDICDVVRCVGFCGTTPVLEFLHKGAHIANITGEKISESQVVDAVRSTTEHLKIHLEYFTVVPAWGEPPRYELMVEERDLAAPAAANGLARQVDSRLQELNCEYREKRMTGRLAPMIEVSLPRGTWKRFAQKRLARLGGSIEQYKHPCLIPDIENSSEFRQEFVPGPLERIH